ncbi:MAG: ribonuclease H-like domain-containing protein [Candidatus Omnitrophica bacterium]|nr:ribonuclease H-like domain-containing protein [Candidatus Omnitrophota bacterium]MDD5352516.1 ribonuclease H-like domain-containing protein [Candidatus Omnitrophota bacterium]MDD5550114.1 ribonuclease H-like domain-containing protein [Candidatus Omnitrophota bacterium]
MGKMKRVAIDIETAGCDFDSLDDISKELLLKYAEGEEEEKEVRESLSFYPLTAQVVAIGMIDIDSDSSFIFYQNPKGEGKILKEKDTEFIAVPDEKELLGKFWKKTEEYQQVITFNGRAFDCPFLMIRSAINHVNSSKNLMPNRYSSDMHIDLLDRLTFYGSMRRRFNLHMWCKAFGIASPKEGEVTGYQVKDLFKAGEFLKIAKYCLGDIIATKKLFQYWDKYLNF